MDSTSGTSRPSRFYSAHSAVALAAGGAGAVDKTKKINRVGVRVVLTPEAAPPTAALADRVSHPSEGAGAAKVEAATALRSLPLGAAAVAARGGGAGGAPAGAERSVLAAELSRGEWVEDVAALSSGLGSSASEIPEVIRIQEFIRSHPLSTGRGEAVKRAKSGLSRTVLVISPKEGYKIYNRSGAKGPDVPVGKGGFKTVYNAEEVFSRHMRATYTFRSDDVESMKEVGIMSCMKPDSGIVSIGHLISYEGKGGVMMNRVIMDLYPAGSLMKWIKSKHRLDYTVKKQIALSIFRGVTNLHLAGYFHRDIKPDNIFIDTRDGDLNGVLGDLGLACKKNDHERLRHYCGTLMYMSPEYAMAIRTADPEQIALATTVAHDYYALGLTFYQFFTGRKELPWLPKKPKLAAGEADPTRIKEMADLWKAQVLASIAMTATERKAIPFPPDVPLPMRDLIVGLLNPLPAKRTDTALLPLAMAVFD